MNYMKDFAKHLGIKLDEHFSIKPVVDTAPNPYADCVLYFSEFGLNLIQYHDEIVKRERKGDYDNIVKDIFYDLAVGVFEIKKLPWKPKYDEMYYFPDILAGIPVAGEDDWGENATDYNRYKANIVCKTEAEAVKKARKMLAVLKEKEK